MATASPAGSLSFRALGAELAITYVNDKTRSYVKPLARKVGASIFLPLNFQTPGQLEQVFERITRDWGRIDFLGHSVASAPKEAGRISDDHGCFLLVLHPPLFGSSDGAAPPARLPHCPP